MLGYHPNLNSADCSAKEHFHVRKSSNSCSSFSLDRLVFGAFGTLTLLIVVLVFVICCADLGFRANQRRRLGISDSRQLFPCAVCDGKKRTMLGDCRACNASGKDTKVRRVFIDYFKELMTEQIKGRGMNLEDLQGGNYVNNCLRIFKKEFRTKGLDINKKEIWWKSYACWWFHDRTNDTFPEKVAAAAQKIAADMEVYLKAPKPEEVNSSPETAESYSSSPESSSDEVLGPRVGPGPRRLG